MYVLRLITWRIHGEQIGEEFPAFKKLPGGRNLDQMPLSLACKLTLGLHVIWNPIQASAASQSMNLDCDLRAELFESCCPTAACTSER